MHIRWCPPAGRCQTAELGQCLPSGHYNILGFRMVLDVPEKVEPPKEAK